MSLILTEIRELRDLGNKVMAGEYNKHDVRTRLDIYNQTAKRINMLIQIAVKAENNGNKDKIWKRLDTMNVIDESVAIDMGAADVKIKCPEHGGGLITRDDCMDFSGSERNIDRCQKCEQFTITRKQIMP